MVKFRIAVVAAALAIMPFLSTEVSAATCQAMSGPQQTVDYELIQSATPPSPDNVLMFECEDDANDTNTIDPSYSIFGMTGWILSDKSDGFSPKGPLTWVQGSDGFVGPQPGGTTWKVGGTLTGITDVFVTLVQKNSFAAFKLDLAELLEGTWSTSDLEGNGFDISHGSIYYKQLPGTGPQVPVPAGLPLMLTAIGIGAYMRKRARKSA